MATTIETDLKEVLAKIDGRLEHIKSGQASASDFTWGKRYIRDTIGYSQLR